MSLTPLEWLSRLGGQLKERWPRLDRWDRYYRGDHDLPAGPSQHAEAFMRFQRFARTNLCGVAVDSMVDRLHVEGYRDGSPAGAMDAQVWGWWQAASMDGRQTALYRTALAQGSAYVIVGPGGDVSRPRVTIERPGNVITERDPADPAVTLAALRCWYDPFVKRWLSTVYVPGERHYFRHVNTSDGKLMLAAMFDPAAWEVRQKPDRSTELVPVVAFENGDELRYPVAEFDRALDVQDRLNLTLLNRLTAERYASFRQRWVTNIQLEDDPVTGLPLSPFKPGVNQVWTAEPPAAGEPETRFGDFQQTDTTQMLRAVEADMRAFAALTRTPLYYMPGDMINVGADAIAALDAGHNAKCRHVQSVWGEDHETVLRLCAEVAGVKRELSSAEIIWRRPENFSPAQVADYGSKLTGMKVPLPLVLEQMGWTPQQIDRARSEQASQAALQAFLTPPPPVQAAAAPVAPVEAPAGQ